MGVFHSPPLPSGQEAYIEALSELSSIVCGDSEELKRLEQQMIREPLNREVAEEMWHLRAELVRKYVQEQLRGGLN
jgi:hypothetical protein